jgi:hypothetical protein
LTGEQTEFREELWGDLVEYIRGNGADNYKIPNETVALAAHWLLFLAAIIAITAGVGVLLFLATRWIWNLYRDNCLDVISVIVSVISIAVIVYFGAEIKGMFRLNLIGLLLLVQALYVSVRSYVRGCKRARGYY